MKNFWTVIIVIGIVIVILNILNRPDRELTPQEKRDNVSICHQYYGNGQEYEDCVNGNNMGKD
jgi:hypothetical protein